MREKLESKARHVLVTGGSTGIGLATAARFGANGDRVTVIARNRAPLDAARTLLINRGIEVQAFEGSVSSAEDVEAFVGEASRQFGPIDVLVNNAGIGTESLIVDMQVKDWQQLIDVNLTGVFLTSQLVARSMVADQRRGVILVNGSINAFRPKTPAIAYACTKAALDVFVRGLAAELGPVGIRVCGVHPGYTATEMLEKVYPLPGQLDAWVAERIPKIPLRRLGKPEEIAAVFFFLASREASYITGTSVTVDGGRTGDA